MTATEPDPRRARAAFLLCGVGILVCWPTGAGLGAFLGSVVASPEALGLDAAFPALLAALAIPALRSGATWAAAVVGGAIAIASTPFLPAGLPVVGALAGFAGIEVMRRFIHNRAPSAAEAEFADHRGQARSRGPPMSTGLSLGVGVALLAVGTYAIRLAGPILRNRISVSAQTELLMDTRRGGPAGGGRAHPEHLQVDTTSRAGRVPPEWRSASSPRCYGRRWRWSSCSPPRPPRNCARSESPEFDAVPLLFRTPASGSPGEYPERWRGSRSAQHGRTRATVRHVHQRARNRRPHQPVPLRHSPSAGDVAIRGDGIGRPACERRITPDIKQVYKPKRES